MALENDDGKVLGPAPPEIQIYCGAAFTHRQDLALDQRKLSPRSPDPGNIFRLQRGEIGVGPKAMAALAALFGALTEDRRRLCRQFAPKPAPDLAPAISCCTDCSFIVRIGECDQPAVSILLGAEPLQPQLASGNELFAVCSRLLPMTSIAANRNSRPSASNSVRPSRTLATVPVPVSVSLQGSCAAAPHTRARRSATRQICSWYLGQRKMLHEPDCLNSRRQDRR